MADTAALVPAPESQVPIPFARRGIDEAQWRTLCNSLYPGAAQDSVLMVIDYCRARNLDPLKKPCHIVPMEVKDARTNTKAWRDVVMPGIYEYRITAHRTGLYLGHTKPQYGPTEKIAGVEAPAWCEMTFLRWNAEAKREIEFPVQVFFSEVVKTKDGKASSRWSQAPIQMLTKCTEAAGLRETFPEEFGGEHTAEEMEGRTIDAEVTQATTVPKPAQRISEQLPAQSSPPAATNGGSTAGSGGSPAAATTSSASPVAQSSPAPTSTQPQAAASKSTPAQANIGVIVKVDDAGNGWALIVLDTKFQCLTNNVDAMTSAASLRDSKRRVELDTRANAKGEKYTRILEGITPLPDGAA